MDGSDDLAGLTDEQLAERCRSSRQDNSAWSELRARFQHLVRWKVAGLTVPKGWIDFDDYVSLVWVRLLEQIEQYESPRGRFRSFLMVLTHNLVLDQLRAQRREALHTMDFPQETSLKEPRVFGPPVDLLEVVVEEVDRSIQDPRKRLIFGELQAGVRVSDIARRNHLDPSYVRRAKHELEAMVIGVLDEILPPK
jgi:DNA-directed RNA polymerase specialized sigma24 family protein